MITRVELSMQNLSHNMQLLQKCVGSAGLRPAVKANAYGHGAEIVARHLVSIGYRKLCVAHVSEALELLERGIDANFMIFAPDLGDSAREILRWDLEPAVCTSLQLTALSKAAVRAGKMIRIHLKVDTGMGRAGFPFSGFPEILEKALSLPGIHVAGIMSHFPRADEADESYTRSQIDRFAAVVKAAHEKGKFLYHIANSSGLFRFPEAHYDFCRPGIAIYGLHPFKPSSNGLVEKLRPVLSWKSAITQLKEIPAGTGISYSHTFITKRSSLIATIPLGYGDGYFRILGNRSEFIIRGKRCPQVGTICMDQCMVDVSALRGEVKQGDEIVIIGSQGEEVISAEELAGKAETINYEIVTKITERVPRVLVVP